MFKTSPIPSSQPLISRDYRGDVDLTVIDKFLPLVLDCEEEGNPSPILVHEKATFIYIKHNNLYCIPFLSTWLCCCCWAWVVKHARIGVSLGRANTAISYCMHHREVRLWVWFGRDWWLCFSNGCVYHISVLLSERLSTV